MSDIILVVLKDLVTTRMVNLTSNIKSNNKKCNNHLSGKRLALFGLHTFHKKEVEKYERTGKSDYVVVPIIGATHMKTDYPMLYLSQIPKFHQTSVTRRAKNRTTLQCTSLKGKSLSRTLFVQFASQDRFV